MHFFLSIPPLVCWNHPWSVRGYCLCAMTSHSSLHRLTSHLNSWGPGQSRNLSGSPWPEEPGKGGRTVVQLEGCNLTKAELKSGTFTELLNAKINIFSDLAKRITKPNIISVIGQHNNKAECCIYSKLPSILCFQ